MTPACKYFLHEIPVFLFFIFFLLYVFPDGPAKTKRIIDRLLFEGMPLAPPMPHTWETSSDEAFYARNSGGEYGGDDGKKEKYGQFANWIREAMLMI